jgi:hypothetical protein
MILIETDTQERFYFPCNKFENYTKIIEKISKHFAFVSKNFSKIGYKWEVKMSK